MEQYLLAIDTSSKALSVALLRGTERLAEEAITAERNHSIYLLPVVQRLLASCDISVHQLQAVAVGRGPGSYTGVRIGVTVAKTIAWSVKIPLIGVSSLSALAHSARMGSADGVKLFVPMYDARRGQVYSALYADDNGWWKCLTEDCIVSAEQWLDDVAEMCKKHAATELVLTGDTQSFGDAIERIRERVNSSSTTEVRVCEGALSAYHVGILARMRWLNGEHDDLHSLVPNYTQLAEAEAKLLATRAAISNPSEA